MHVVVSIFIGQQTDHIINFTHIVEHDLGIFIFKCNVFDHTIEI